MLAQLCPMGGYQIRRLHLFQPVIFIVLLLLLIGALPAWPRSWRWRYFPGAGLALLLLVIFVLLTIGTV